MPAIKLETRINAPVGQVFDLARCIDLHADSMGNHGEKAIGGVTSGLIGMGETVTWEALHFGIRQNLTSTITQFDRPRHFRDSLVRGAFSSFDHDHYFEPVEDGTLMRDVFRYVSPLRFFGQLADHLFLERYMTRLLEERNRVVKNVAETELWRKYLS